MTRTIGAALVLGILLLGLIVVRMSFSFTSFIPLQQSEKVSEQATGEWLAYTAPDGNFRVQLPLLPQRAQEVDDDRHYDMYVSELPDGTTYMISYIRFPLSEQAPDDELLSKIVQDMVRSNPDNILEKVSKGKYEEWRAVDFTIKNSQNTIITKAFMKGLTMVVLTGIFKQSEEANKDFAHFINSFEVLQ